MILGSPKVSSGGVLERNGTNLQLVQQAGFAGSQLEDVRMGCPANTRHQRDGYTNLAAVTETAGYISKLGGIGFQ